MARKAFKMRSQSAVSSGGFKQMGSSANVEPIESKPGDPIKIQIEQIPPKKDDGTSVEVDQSTAPGEETIEQTTPIVSTAHETQKKNDVTTPDPAVEVNAPITTPPAPPAEPTPPEGFESLDSYISHAQDITSNIAQGVDRNTQAIAGLTPEPEKPKEKTKAGKFIDSIGEGTGLF